MGFRDDLSAWEYGNSYITSAWTEGHPVSVSHGLDSSSQSTGADGGGFDVTSLLNMLGEVVNRRDTRGKVHGLAFVLAASLVAVLTVAKNFQQAPRHQENHRSDLPRPHPSTLSLLTT